MVGGRIAEAQRNRADERRAPKRPGQRPPRPWRLGFPSPKPVRNGISESDSFGGRFHLGAWPKPGATFEKWHHYSCSV